jgi:hypothetical protein
MGQAFSPSAIYDFAQKLVVEVFSACKKERFVLRLIWV